MARIENWQEKYEKLEKLSQNHDTCNVTEFSKWIGISRQAFYNWKQNGFIIFQGHGDMPRPKSTEGQPFRLTLLWSIGGSNP